MLAALVWASLYETMKHRVRHRLPKESSLTRLVTVAVQINLKPIQGQPEPIHTHSLTLYIKSNFLIP